MFADETKIIGKIRLSHPIEDQQVIQENINRIADWCKELQMYLNIEKCKTMRVENAFLNKVHRPKYSPRDHRPKYSH